MRSPSVDGSFKNEPGGERRVLSLPGCDVALDADLVAAVLRDRESNWTIERESGPFQVPLDDVDELTWRAVREAARSELHLMIGVPRVETGISIGCATALMIGSLMHRNKRIPEGAAVKKILEVAQRHFDILVATWEAMHP